MAKPSTKDTVRLSVTLIALAVVGAMLVAAALVFLAKSYRSDGKVDENVVALLLVGLSVLIVVEVLPTLQNLKFGKDGFEFSFRDFGEKVTTDADALASRVNDLEAAVATLATAPAQTATSRRKAAAAISVKDVPLHLLEPGDYKDDPRKGRFGAKREVGGFRLSAEFPGPLDKAWTEVVLRLEAGPEAGDVGDVETAEFFLHHSFKRPRITAQVHNGCAKLNLTVWGGFTVGVWIPARDITLELDLALLPDAPKIVREL
jgi:hypothetical protein